MTGCTSSCGPPRKMEESIFVETNVTINQLLEVEQYPVPKPSDLISAILWGGGGSSKLDLAWAYHQIVLKEETRKLFQHTWDFSATPGCLLRWHQPLQFLMNLWPSLQWQNIRVDFAGPFLRRTFLIVVHAHSK